MTTTTLTKWGNSQGVLIPKDICAQIDVHVGDKLEIKSDGESITIAPTKPVYKRTEHLSIEKIFEGWTGTYEPPTDWPTNGNEIDWGEPQGAEVWQ